MPCGGECAIRDNLVRLMTAPDRRPGVINCLADWIERHGTAALVAVGLVLALTYGVALEALRKPDGRIVTGDAVHYYVYLRSWVFDQDIHFRNEYIRLYRLQGGEEGTEWIYQETPTGHVRNMMAIGTPVAWAPAYLVGVMTLCLTALAGVTGWPDGFERILQASAGFSGIAAATVGTVLTYRMCRRLFGARLALVSTLAIWLGSSALYYSLVSPTYSHATSMMVVSGLFLYWAGSRQHQTLRRYLILGALIGLAALVRWQDAVFVVLPFIDAIAAGRKRLAGFDWAGATRHLGAAGVGAVLVFSVQMIVWLVLYGQPLVIPQSEGFMQWHAPHLGSVLFSDWHGLFTWTPIVALAVAGLIPLHRRDPWLAAGLLAAFLASWWANGSVADWWAGEAFGARRFVSGFPIFVVGFAALFDWMKLTPRSTLVMTAVLVSLNLLLLLQYQLFMHGWRDLAPYPRGWYGLLIARFVVPIDLIERLMGE